MNVYTNHVSANGNVIAFRYTNALRFAFLLKQVDWDHIIPSCRSFAQLSILLSTKRIL